MRLHSGQVKHALTQSTAVKPKRPERVSGQDGNLFTDDGKPRNENTMKKTVEFVYSNELGKDVVAEALIMSAHEFEDYCDAVGHEMYAMDDPKARPFSYWRRQVFRDGTTWEDCSYLVVLLPEFESWYAIAEE